MLVLNRRIFSLRSKLMDPTGKVNHRKLELAKAIQKKDNNDYTGMGDKILNELFITGQFVFEFFSPGAKAGSYRRFITYIYTLANILIFIYMAGDYTWTRFYDCGDSNAAGEIVHYSGPKRLVGWIIGRESWRHFSTEYLVDWGGRALDKIKDGERYRWFSSWFLHESFDHLAANMCLFFVLAHTLEAKYGWIRMFIICFLSGLGGSFFSAVMEDSCIVVVGASGICFGLFGLFIADLVLNHETIKQIYLRIGMIMLFLSLFVLQILTEGSTSHWSHAGGILAGLFPSFLLLPNFKR